MKVHAEVPKDRKGDFEHIKDHFNRAHLDFMYLLKEHEPLAFSVTSIISPAWGRFYGTQPLNPQSTETLNLYQAESGFRSDLTESSNL